MAMQHTQQPFFKPTSSPATNSGSFFLNYNNGGVNGRVQSHKSGAGVLAPQQQQFNGRPSIATSPNASCFRHSTPTRQREKENEHENKVQTPDRLQSLHTRLHQEAEKIRKWKTSTEIDLKDKDKKLQEASQTIDSLRKSILELQLQNESLSSKLQDEIDSREEVSHKVLATRDLCNALKDHVAIVVDRVEKGEADRDELSFLDKQRVEQYQEMVVKFQELEIQHSEKHSDMKKRLEEQKTKHADFLAESREKLKVVESQIHNLKSENEEKGMNISSMKTELDKKEERCRALEDEIEELTDNVEKSESIITSKKVQLENTEEMLSLSKEETKKINTELFQVKSLLKEAEENYVEQKTYIEELNTKHQQISAVLQQKLLSLEDEVEDGKGKLDKSSHDIDEARKIIAETQQDLESMTAQKDAAESLAAKLEHEKGKIVLECGKLKEAVATDMKEKAEKEKMLRMLENKEKDFQQAIMSLTDELRKELSEKERLKEQQCTMTSSFRDKKDEIEKLRKQVMEATTKEKDTMECVKELHTKLENERKQKSDLESKLLKLKGIDDIQNKELEARTINVSKLEKELQEAKLSGNAYQEKVQQLVAAHQILQEECNQVKRELAAENKKTTTIIEKEQEAVKSLQNELDSKSKQAINLESKLKNLQTQLANKTKQIKEIKLENKTLKTKLGTQTKTTGKSESKIQSLTEELDGSREEVEKLNEKLEATKERLENEIEGGKEKSDQVEILLNEIENKIKENKSLEQQMTKLQEETNKAVADKDCAQTSFELQMNELCATLEKYKVENEKIVAQKERELDGLRHKAETEIETANNKEVIEVKKKLKELQEKFKLVQSDKDELAKQIDEKDKGFAALKKDFKHKESQLQDLQKEMERSVKQQQLAQTPRTPICEPPPTPRTPKVTASTTPSLTPSVTPGKQQRGILKQQRQTMKKRRVVFAASDESASGTSDEEEVLLTKKGKQLLKVREEVVDKEERKVPTKIVRPNVRQSPKPASWEQERTPVTLAPTTIPQRQPPKPVPRGKSLNLQKQKKLKINDGGQDEEMEKFKELFPDLKSQTSLYDPSPGKNKKESPTATRKSPFVTKAVTKGRKPAVRKKKEGRKNLEWFDSDAVFGFGPDDE